MELIVLSNSPIRLNTSEYFSLEQGALWFLTPTGFLPPSPFVLSTALCQYIPSTFCQALSWRDPCSLHPFETPQLSLYAMVARIDCSCARLGPKMVAHCPDLSSVYLSCLTVQAHGHEQYANVHLWGLLCSIFSSQSQRHSTPSWPHLV